VERKEARAATTVGEPHARTTCSGVSRAPAHPPCPHAPELPAAAKSSALRRHVAVTNGTGGRGAPGRLAREDGVEEGHVGLARVMGGARRGLPLQLLS
jgi:hypothetical protein